ncbi:MAG: hypothetical protein P4L66_11475 [Acetobacteraceae bacterium]|nr:hypothetical protein [Acetobacteraceae bacterium]
MSFIWRSRKMYRAIQGGFDDNMARTEADNPYLPSVASGSAELTNFYQ